MSDRAVDPSISDYPPVDSPEEAKEKIRKAQRRKSLWAEFLSGAAGIFLAFGMILLIQHFLSPGWSVMFIIGFFVVTVALTLTLQRRGSRE